MEPLIAEDPRSTGGYELLGRLGQGGFGQVYLGLSPAGRAVAVKVLRSDLRQDGRLLQRLHKEVAAARRVNGFYTAQVVADGLYDRPPWMATVFVPGPPLSRVIENGPLPETALWRLLAGLVEALKAIHGCGLVHRDLKPANVLLAADGPRVIDFGISKSVDSTGMTSTGTVVGTPSFMAPEQAAELAVGPAADVFSLGSVLAYAATGEPPFGRDRNVALYRIVHTPPSLAGIPPQLRAVIERCLAKEPQARPTLNELVRIGRDGPEVIPAQSSVAFWPPEVGQLIKEYEGQFDGVPHFSAAAARLRATAGASADWTSTEKLPNGQPGTLLLTANDDGGGDSDDSSEHGGSRRRVGRRLFWAGLASAAAVLAAITATAIELSGGSAPAASSTVAAVPDVQGMTWPQALRKIEKAQLTPVEKLVASTKVKADGVISESPAAGQHVPMHSRVTVKVSKGSSKDSHTVGPKTSPPASPSATSSRTAASAPSSVYPDGSTTSPTSTAPGTPTPPPSKTTQSTEVQVPDVTGGNWNSRVPSQTLTSANLKVDPSCIPDQNVPSGVIISQNPAPGKLVSPGTTVQVTISTYGACPAF